MAADFVACHCKKCDRNCCTSKNDWIELDSGHRTYREPKFFTNVDMLPTGKQKLGVKEFKDCYTQSLYCAGCEEWLGFTCVETIREKAPYRDRDFLVLSSFVLKSVIDGSQVVPVIKKKDLLSPRETSTPQPTLQANKPYAPIPKVPNPPATTLSSKFTTPAPQAPAKGLPAKDTELITRHVAKAMSKSAVSETANGHSTTASQASKEGSSHVSNGVTDVDGAKARSAVAEYANSTLPDIPASSKAPRNSEPPSGPSKDIKALLDGQRADIDRIAANVDCLTRDMKSITASLDYLKFQQMTFAEHETAPSPTVLAEDVHVLTREQRLLTESVAQLRTTPTEVEKLRAELEILKQRMQYIEDTISPERRTGSGSVHSTRSVSRPGKQRRLSSHAQSDSVNVSENTYERRDSEQFYAGSPMLGEDMTPENESFGIEQPQITSAGKVAARNRRRLSDSSSDTRPPTKKRGRLPKNRGKPDGTTKAVSLNNHQTVLTSDPEDDDYDPDKNTQEMLDARMNGRPLRPGRLQMTTPEWEKPDWEGPSLAPPNNIRGKTTVRRGVSGRGPLVDRDMARRRSSGYGNGDYVYHDSPQYWDDQSLVSTQADLRPDPFEKPRDSEGRLLRPNGKIDGRSLRYKRAAEEKARQAAVQQQLQMTSQDSKHVTEGQQKEMQAMGLKAPGTGQSFVDAAALQAARNSGAASPATPATSNAIKDENNRVDGNDEGGPSTTAGATAPRPQTDRHAAFMKGVFPWR
ncbi:MAG: hypothetical protein Q9226_006032 [Calogaya cf. arnoldii]